VTCWTWADDGGDLVAARQQEPNLAVLVDDADQVLDTPADAVLRAIAGDARRGRGLVACAADTTTLLTQYRGTAVEVARAQTGILLSPQGISDGELFGVRTARSLERVPGRGLLAVRGSATEIQVARTGATGCC
jgi:S-DNA-T family DNA segregation ATPase FtsK/SpoIIIE